MIEPKNLTTQSDQNIPVLSLPETSHANSTSIDWKKIAVKTAKIIGIALLSAAALVGTGHVLRLAGSKIITGCGTEQSLSRTILRSLGEGTNAAGDKLFFTGKCIFLSIAVPVYTVTWVIPKWTVTIGFPKAITFLHRVVLVPIKEGIIQAGMYMENLVITIAQNTYNYALKPLAMGIHRTANLACQRVILPLLENVHNVTATFKRSLYQYVLEPLEKGISSALEKIFNAVIIPSVHFLLRSTDFALSRLENIACAVYRFAVKPLVIGIKFVSTLIHQYAVIPVSQAFIKCATLLNQTTAAVANAIHRFILIPFCKGVGSAAKFAHKYLIIPTSSTFTKGMTILQNLMASFAKVIHRYALIPIANKAVTSARVAHQYLWLPLSNGIIQGLSLTAKLAQMIYQLVVWPAIGATAQGLSLMMNMVKTLAQGVFQSVLTGLKEVQGSFIWTSKRAVFFSLH